MRKIQVIFTAAAICISIISVALAEDVITGDISKKAPGYKAMIPVEMIRSVALPDAYHEGISVSGEKLWIANGEGFRSWLIDADNGSIVEEVGTSGPFTETVVPLSDGKFWISDWGAKKIYLARKEGAKLVEEISFSTEPSHPAGITVADDALYAILWTRGLGTKYYLAKMDFKGRTVEKLKISCIPEPSQITWDGTDLWISSWFNRRVYRIDAGDYSVKGYFRTKIEMTTGIAWDGEGFWVTGTNEGLYKFILKK